MKEAYLKDLEIQWNDHFHMRDQTWKTLTYTAVFFIGIVGFEIKEANDFVMICLYSLLMVVAVFGWSTASHHRVRQKEKFAFIKMYEEKLELFDLKKDIINEADTKSGPAGKIFTAFFIEVVQICFGLIGLVLLINRIVIA